MSPRQQQALALMAAGLSERGVARRLGISRATVGAHLARARERLGARSTCQAVAIAVRGGLIGPLGTEEAGNVGHAVARRA